jgi:hypothetical protein
MGTNSALHCRPAGQNRLLALNYIYPGEDAAVCAAHAAWGDAFQALHAGHLLPEVTPAERDITPGRQLRVRTRALRYRFLFAGFVGFDITVENRRFKTPP